MTTIKTKLLREEEVDYLEFTFVEDEAKRININDPTDNSTLRSVFNDIIKLAMQSDVSLESLEVDPSIGGGLLAEVFTEYISDLNKEISKIRAELRTEGQEEE